MIGKKTSVKKMFFWLTAGMVLSMTAIILVSFFLTKNIAVLWVGLALTVCAALWMLFMVQLLGMRLSNFTSELCQILDDMMNRSQGPAGKQPEGRSRETGITVPGVRYFPSGQDSGEQHENDCRYTFDKIPGRTGAK